MFQAGEVDYLVATDAIGMGLNMDVHHVAFASLGKFDGRRERRLHIHEMAQIAGRAGRHQRDGTFGTLALEGREKVAFRDEEIEAIEAHEFPMLRQLYWREGDPRFDTADQLVADLEAKPVEDVLRPAPQALDLAVLKALVDEGWVRDRIDGPAMVKRLWAICGLPDFRKTGVEAHARLVSRLFRHLSEGDGHIPTDVFAREVDSLENLAGDVDTLSGRLAAIRTWAYVAHRDDWLAKPDKAAERTRTIEQRLSDALHESLTQRFVDRRTTVLMRDLGARGEDVLPVRVDSEGVVTVDEEPIGRIEGFRFIVEQGASHGDTKRLLAAAERRLGGEWAARAAALVADQDDAFSLVAERGERVAIAWHGETVARLATGKSLLAPKIELRKTLNVLTPEQRHRVAERLQNWFDSALAEALGPLLRVAAAIEDQRTQPALRAVLAPVLEGGGIAARKALLGPLDTLSREQRHVANRLGLTIGALDIFLPPMLKPKATRWRLALAAAQHRRRMLAEPPPGTALLDLAAGDDARSYRQAGFRAFEGQMVRIDMIERLSRAAHDARDGKKAFAPDRELATSLGLSEKAEAALMRALGFQRAGTDEQDQPCWIWRGRRKPRRKAAKPAPGNAFAKLAELDLGHG